MPDYPGNNGDNTITGSNGADTISGLGGNDTLSGGNGNDTISGGDGNDAIDGGNGNDDIDGGSGNDDIEGGNGNDDIDGGDDNDVIYGGNGGDDLLGGAGDDELYGQNGDDQLTGGAGNDLLDGNNGFDTAYYSGTIDKYSFFAAAGYLHVVHLGGAGADGHDRLIRVERLVFADRVINIGSGNNAPVAGDDHVFIDEDAGTYGSGTASVLDNDFDFDGDALTVTGGVFVGTYGTLTINADGTYSYALNASAQALAQGDDATDSFNYTVSDNDGSDTGTLVFHVAGVNDAPTANPDSDTTSENAVLLVDVLANDDDIDNGAVLTVTAASAPSGQGSASVIGDQVEFDPGSDFDDLNVGDSEAVVVGYDIEDEHGATSSSTLTITVTGTNDGPVANPDTDTTSENAVLTVDVLANDTDADTGATLTVTAASAPVGQGSASVVGNQVQFDPGTDFDDLNVGDSEVVVANYVAEDEHGATSSSTLTITVTGTNDGPVANPDTDTTSENAILAVDVLANDTDVDTGAVLTVTAASAPLGQGSASVVGNQVEFDPGNDFDDLNVGDSEVVVVSYDIEDEHGATSSSTLTITVTGTNDGPVAVADFATTTENGTELSTGTAIQVGGEILVNTETVDDQQLPTITGLTNGGFVVSWFTTDPTQDGHRYAIKAQLFDASGAKLGGELLVNTQTTSYQYDPTITGLTNGGFVVSWATDDSSQDGSGAAIKAQVFDAGGVMIGGEFLVNTQAGGYQQEPAVTGLTNGGFVISWGDLGLHPDGSGYAIKAQIFDAGGVMVGSEFIANTQTANDQYNPTITGLTNGGFVVSWFTTDTSQDGSGIAVKAQIFDAGGAMIGGEFLVNTETSGDQSNPTITALTNGGFVVSWYTNNSPEDGDNGAIRAQIFDASGAMIGGEFLVNTETAGNQYLPTITGLSGGGFVVSWTTYDSTQDGSGFAIKAQVFDAGGAMVGGEFLVNTEAAMNQNHPTITGLSGGGFVISWTTYDPAQDGSGLAVKAQVFALQSAYEPLLFDVLANDTDADNGATLTVTAASAPLGQGSASVVGNQVEFDPGSDFDDLAVGESEVVVVGYDIEDEHGAPSSSTLTITVTGTNDDPVANPDTATTGESSSVTLDVLANDTDADNQAILTIVAASAPAGQGSVTIDEDRIRFDPGSDFSYLEVGESAVVVISYTITDEHGATASSTATVTVEGREEGTSNTGTEGPDTLTGTSGDDTIDALGGDDTAFGLAGNDLILGGSGTDQLDGGEDNDVIEGGDDDDVLLGGDGNDQLLGQAGNDSIAGDAGVDLIEGGDGFDTLYGDAGDDVIEGGNDDDVLVGGDGNDQLLGQAGNDSFAGDAGDDQLTGGDGDDGLDGGEGDDTLVGGNGNDALTDFSGINSLVGGLGNDQIAVGASGGAQTVDAGDGNDTIRHYGRQFASTIATGSGSDTVELLQANLGTAAIVVSDFTPGAGGDKVRLSGDESALLSLLSGWDGSSNPFGSGFLRLQQSGADTLLEWDQDGTAGGSAWETLVVFENTDTSAFTDANFVPGYHPDGSALAGQTIVGTGESEALTGTISDDTIDALGGDDTVFGLAGVDLIDGGDGFDTLYGDAGDDVIEGGNDDDVLLGGDGNDQLLGQAGNDSFAGDAGDDQLSGGDGDDGLDGGEGDDTLVGGDGDDALTDFGGINSLAGGLGNDQIAAGSAGGAQTIDAGDGNDTIRHYGRQFASTIATGSGSDTVELLQANLGTAALVVSDFTPGAGGDMVQLSNDEGGLLSLLSGWDGSSNPFGSGFLRLQQSGADAVLEWDQDGAAGGSGWEALMVFENTDADAFTEANFVPGFDPDGAILAGETIVGTGESEKLAGTIGDDTIDALGGDDTVFGLAGVDVIDGGDGFDYLSGDAGDDVIEGGSDDDVLLGGDGNDQLLGQAGNDSFAGDAGNDQLTGGDGDDGLDGGDGDDTLVGGNGDDFVLGSAGSDALSGGAGADIFHYRFALDGLDVIADFVSGSDKISVSADGFGGGLIAGGEVLLISGTNPGVEGASGQFLFDTDDGRLLWDADGTGSDDPLLIATFTTVPALVTSDFVVG